MGISIATDGLGDLGATGCVLPARAQPTVGPARHNARGHEVHHDAFAHTPHALAEVETHHHVHRWLGCRSRHEGD
eukprot:8149784-Alexandrium_andersonii.AAC.1